MNPTSPKSRIIKYRNSFLFAGFCVAAASAVQAESHQPSLQFDCVVDPSLVLNLGSAVSGLIDDVKVETGSAVTKDQVIAQLQSTSEEAQLAQVRTRAESDAQVNAQRAALDLAQVRSDRVAELYDRSVATDVQVEEAQAELAIAKMNLRVAELNQTLDVLALEEAAVNMALRSIKSPVNGVVISRNLGPGEFVSPDNPVVTVAQINPLHVRALLPVDLYAHTSEGQTVTVTLNLPEHTDVSADIIVVDKVLNAAAGTFGIRAEITNPGNTIPAGQTCLLSVNAS